MTIRVGIYDQPQVQPQAAPGGRLNVQAPNLGAPLAEGLNKWSEAFTQEVDRISQKRVEAFQNELDAFDLQQRSEMLKIKGQAALLPGSDGESPFSPFVAKRSEFIQNGVKDMTPAQAEAARRVAAKSDVRVNAEWISHQDNEQQNWAKSVALNGAQVQADVALANYSKPKEFKEALDNMGYHIQEAHPGVEVSSLVADKKSGVALEALRSMVSNNVVVSPANSAHLMEVLSPVDKMKADEMMKKGNAANLAIKAAMDYLPSKPSGDEVQATADWLFSTEGTPYYNNAEAHKELITLGNQKVAANLHTQSEFDRQKFGDIKYRVGMGNISTSTARVELAALKGKLSDEAAGDAAVWLHNYDKAEKKTDEELFPAMVAFVTSDAFSSLTREEMLKSLSNFGRLGPNVFTAWKQTQEEGGKFAIPAAVRESVITTLEASDGFKRKEEADKNRLDLAILQATDDLRSKGKGIYATKSPTPTEMYEAVLARAKNRAVTSGFLGMFGTKVPLAKMTPDQRKLAVSNLSAEDKKLISTHLNLQGISSGSAETIFAAKDEIDALREGNGAAYQALWNRAFPPSLKSAYTLQNLK